MGPSSLYSVIDIDLDACESAPEIPRLTKLVEPGCSMMEKTLPVEAAHAQLP